MHIVQYFTEVLWKLDEIHKQVQVSRYATQQVHCSARSVSSDLPREAQPQPLRKNTHFAWLLELSQHPFPRALGAVEWGSGQALPLGWWVSSRNCRVLLASHPSSSGVAKRQSNQGKKKKSVQTNMQFANLLRIDTSDTWEEFDLILLLGLLIN